MSIKKHSLLNSMEMSKYARKILEDYMVSLRKQSASNNKIESFCEDKIYHTIKSLITKEETPIDAEIVMSALDSVGSAEEVIQEYKNTYKSDTKEKRAKFSPRSIDSCIVPIVKVLLVEFVEELQNIFRWIQYLYEQRLLQVVFLLV